MTISRECRDGPYVVQCDDCLDTEELEGAQLPEAVEDAKERGYEPYRLEGKWHHSCGYCIRQAEQQVAA